MKTPRQLKTELARAKIHAIKERIVEAKMFQRFLKGTIHERYANNRIASLLDQLQKAK